MKAVQYGAGGRPCDDIEHGKVHEAALNPGPVLSTIGDYSHRRGILSVISTIQDQGRPTL